MNALEKYAAKQRLIAGLTKEAFAPVLAARAIKGALAGYKGYKGARAAGQAAKAAKSRLGMGGGRPSTNLGGTSRNTYRQERQPQSWARPTAAAPTRLQSAFRSAGNTVRGTLAGLRYGNRSTSLAGGTRLAPTNRATGARTLIGQKVPKGYHSAAMNARGRFGKGLAAGVGGKATYDLTR